VSSPKITDPELSCAIMISGFSTVRKFVLKRGESNKKAITLTLKKRSANITTLSDFENSCLSL
jgi:hypothetical protein